MITSRTFYVSPERMTQLIKEAFVPTKKGECDIHFIKDKGMFRVTLKSNENYWEGILNDLRSLYMQEKDSIIQDSINTAIHSIETLLDMGVYF